MSQPLRAHMTKQSGSLYSYMCRNSSTQRLKIAYLCDASPLDPGSYSGGNARIYQMLQENVGDVDILPLSWGMAEPLRRLMHRLPERYNARLRWRLHLLFAPIIARAVERAVAKGDYDVLFGVYSFHALKNVTVPDHMVMAYTSDATPTVYKNSEIGASFGSFFGPSRWIDPLITRAEAQTFQAADLLLWPSDWLRDGANQTYGLDPETSLTVPWGANIDPPADNLGAVTISRDAPVHLLFVGRDWYAKGGPNTVATMDHLRAQGIDAQMTVIGCTPPPDVDTDHITVHPMLNKSVPEELALFTSLYHRSHFIVMASMESYGFAFCEASAYGVPSLCLRAGGVPVRDGINGYALPMGSEPEDFAKVIADHIDDPARYNALRASSQEEYKTRLNWGSWGRRVKDLLRAAVAGKTQG